MIPDVRDALEVHPYVDGLAGCAICGAPADHHDEALEEWGQLLGDEVQAHLPGQHDQASHNPYGGGAGITQELPASPSLDPLTNKKKFSRGLREDTVAALESETNGDVLVDALTAYQGGGGNLSEVGRLRGDIEDFARGNDMNPEDALRAGTVVAALRASPNVSGTLFRGISSDLSPQEFAELYKKGDTTDFNLSSFTGDLSAAQKFTLRGENAGKTTRVLMTLNGKKQGIPLQNLARSKTFHDEREILTGGRFKITGVDVSPDHPVVTINLKQEATL